MTTEPITVLTPGELNSTLLRMRVNLSHINELKAQLQDIQQENVALEAAVIATCAHTGERPDSYDLRVRDVKGRASTTYHERELRLALEDTRPELLPAVFTRTETFKFNRKAAEALEDQIGGLDAYRTVTPGVNRLVLEDVRGPA
ncbi:hypothetical protein ACMT4L_06850 [Deinococcus sp. A31D244]|uniref:hypothetical protein n=1 Tax=Deinococcus sp. A31D244 TaxID=3397675 RepID=UPI0039E149DC